MLVYPRERRGEGVNNRSKISSVIIIILTIAAITLNIMPVSTSTKPLASTYSHSANAMWLEPSIINATGKPVGYRFNVTVWVNITVSCGAWQFKMIYNKAYLKAVTCVYTGTNGRISQFFEKAGTVNFPLSPMMNYPHNATHNYVLHGETWNPMIPNNPYASGVGSLSRVTFEVLAEPPEGQEITIKIDISTEHHPPTSKTYVLDPEENEVPLNVYDCTYIAKSPTAPPPPPVELTKLRVYPEEIIDPTMLPSSTFNINITIEDVIDLQVCELNLSYNSGVIGFVSLKAFRVQNQIPTVKSMIDDEGGFIWVKLQYATAFSTDISLPLLMIEFHVNAFGSTSLDLHDTKILNSEGQQMEHQAIDGFFSTLIRDVAVLAIQLERSWTYRGRPINITVTVKNKGNVKETFKVSIYYDNTLIETLNVVDLAPEEIRTITVQWDTTGVSEGNYTIEAEAETVPYELNINDNKLVDGTVWVMTKIHDIAILDVYTPSMAYQGWRVKINVTVQNKGNFNETFEVSAYFNTNLIESIIITSLPPGEFATVTLVWDTRNVTPCTNYTISAKLSILPYELDVQDNSFCDGEIKIRFMGDVNADGYVDLKDLYAIGACYGAHAESPRWNPEYDLDQNKIIDIKDLMLAARNYGKGCQ